MLRLATQTYVFEGHELYENSRLQIELIAPEAYYVTIFMIYPKLNGCTFKGSSQNYFALLSKMTASICDNFLQHLS